MSGTGGASDSAGLAERRFELIYATYFERVAAYLLSRTDRDSAAEAIARTFEIAWRRLSDVPDEPLPWLLGVARRVLAEQRRAAGRHDALIERIAETVTDATEDHAAVLARRELVLAAVSDLTVPQREAVLLIAWDGLTQREAATSLGCSRPALALRLHRARRQLRAALRDEGPDPRAAGDRDPSNGALTHTPVKPSTKEAL